MCNADRKVSKEKEYLDALTNKNVDGIILVKPQTEINVLYEYKKYCELVVVDANDEFKRYFDVINVDDGLGAKIAMEILIEYGHKKIAFISGLMESESSRLRYTSYKKVLADKGLKLDDGLVMQGNYDWHSGYISTVNLLKSKNKPTAIFATNDIMAFGAIKAIRENNMNVPDDISVIGYDDIDMASYSTPQLTTVRQHNYEIGTTCVEMLINRIENPHKEGDSYMSKMLNPEIVFRETVSYAKR